VCKLAHEQGKLMQHHDMIIDLSHAEGNSAYLEVQSHYLQNKTFG